MRILMMISPSRIGGAETHVAAITRQLISLQEQVTLFCPAGRPLVEYLRDRGLAPVAWRTFGKLDLRTLSKLVSLIESRQIDVVHTHLSTASLLGSLAARLTGRPCVATVHGFNSALWYRHATRVIAVSQAIKRHLLAQGLAAESISVIHGGVPLDEYIAQDITQAKLACGFAPSVTRVGVFGRLSRLKGQAVALAAWAQVGLGTEEARLMLVGEGNIDKALRHLATRLGIADRVELPGFSPDPRPLMLACDLVIMPSLQEGLGLAAVEAMALERPVVVSDAGGLTEVISDGETGLVVPRGRPQALAAAIIRMLTDRELASRLAKAGRKRVETDFDLARQTVRLCALSRELLKPVRQADTAGWGG